MEADILYVNERQFQKLKRKVAKFEEILAFVLLAILDLNLKEQN
jgi:hypothetical protein